MEIIKSSYYVSEKHFAVERTPERVTDCYEFELTTAGDGYAVIDGKKYSRTKGSLILAKPNQVRYSIGAFECYYFHFLLDVTDPIKSNVDRLPDFYVPSDISRIEDIYHTVCDRTFMSESNEDMFIKGSVMQLTAELNEIIYPFGVITVGKYDRYLDNIIEAKRYIDANYGGKVFLKDLAVTANLSPNFFRIVFKKILNLSPHEYLIAVRIKKACKHLSETDFPISEIAQLCGFETQSYFNNVFLNEVGTTPYKYRKENRKEM